MVALHAGFDVSPELTSICVVDEEGRMVPEVKVLSEPDAIAEALREAAGEFVRLSVAASPDPAMHSPGRRCSPRAT